MKNLFSILLLLFCSFGSQAQIILNPIFCGAFIVNNQGDTVRGVVKLPKSASKGDFSYTDILWKVRFINQNGAEQKVTPLEAQQVTFWLENGKEVTFTSHPNTTKLFGGLMNNNDKVFLHRVKNGNIKLFKGYFYNSSSTEEEVTTMDFIQKDRGPVRKFKYLFFRYDFIEYIKDNRNLAQKLKKQELKPSEIDKIVEEYNTWYANQNQ
jgi:hypothetical protein